MDVTSVGPEAGQPEHGSRHDEFSPLAYLVGRAICLQQELIPESKQPESAVDPVPCGPVSRFGRPSMMIWEVVHGTEGIPGGVPSAGVGSGCGGQVGGRGRQGCSRSVISRSTAWRRQELIDRGELPGLMTEEREELRAARRRIRELETELAVHRRAAELLKESVRPFGGSRRSR